MESGTAISQAEIIDELNRILQFPVFNNSMILSGFLTFIVDETLGGRAHLLKEYTIGTNVLSKKNGYDPQADASVRIHAGRLRRALHEYYNGPGCSASILISVPKGGYIPSFERVESLGVQPPTKNPAVIYRPTLAVFPFHSFGDKNLEMLADGLCDQICTELTSFSELTVVSYFSSRNIAATGVDLKEAAFLLDATYLLTGTIQASTRNVRVRVQLIRSQSQHQVWACSYEKEKSAIGDFAIQDDIVRHVINQIGGSHGIIFREAAKASPIKQAVDVKAYDAVFWYYYLVHDLSEDTFIKGVDVMRHTVQLEPQYALGWAILGETYVAGFFYGYPCGVSDALEEAVKCGQKALAIDPHCQHTYQTLGLAYLFQHKQKECLQIVEQWIKLKSNAAGIAGGMGFCLICAGEYERGYILLSGSIQVNPYYQWWFNAGLSFYHFQKKEYEDAIYWAEKMHGQSIPWELILKSAAYAELQRVDLARICTEELRKQIPNIGEMLEPMLGSFLQSQDLVDRLSAALRKVNG